MGPVSVCFSRAMLFVCLVVLTRPASATTTFPPFRVPEIPDPTLSDVARVRVLAGNRVVIVYNPMMCARVGREVCEFSRWHEYGHIVLGHPIRPIMPQQMEREADRWAARHAPTRSVRAAYRFFVAGGGSSPIHGAGIQRAARLSGYLKIRGT